MYEDIFTIISLSFLIILILTILFIINRKYKKIQAKVIEFKKVRNSRSVITYFVNYQYIVNEETFTSKAISFTKPKNEAIIYVKKNDIEKVISNDIIKLLILQIILLLLIIMGIILI